MNSKHSPKEFLKAFSDTVLPEFARTLLPEPTAPQPGETAVVALECPKTAALCFDRVWSIPLDDAECPKEIRFSSSSDAELVAALWLQGINDFNDDIKDFSEFQELASIVVNKDYDSLFRKRNFIATYYMALVSLYLAGGFEPVTRQPLWAISRTLCEDLQNGLELRVNPLYGSEAARDAEYKAGNYEVLVTSMRQLEVVDEKALSWEQVLEFRRDIGAKADYRRLIHWLDGEMVGHSHQYVVDEIGIRLEKYRGAIQKHGLKSRIGVLASILDSKTLVPAVAATSGAILAGEPLLGALAAGGMLLGKVLIAVGQAKVDLQEINEVHQEIAFVAQVNERFTDP